MIFRLGELFCGPGGLACGAKMAGSIMANGEEYDNEVVNRRLPHD